VSSESAISDGCEEADASDVSTLSAISVKSDVSDGSDVPAVSDKSDVSTLSAVSDVLLNNPFLTSYEEFYRANNTGMIIKQHSVLRFNFVG